MEIILNKYESLLKNIKKRDLIMKEKVWAIHKEDSKYSIKGIKKQIKIIKKLIKLEKTKDLELECIKCSLKVIDKYYKTLR